MLGRLMSVKKKRKELRRLQEAFASEANRFNDLSLTILYLTQQGPSSDRQFRSPNHLIILWQYYGALSGGSSIDQMMANLENSNLELAGLRGSQFSCFALLEGEKTDLFLRMATRAGTIFSEKEANRIAAHARRDFESNLKQTKPVFVENRNLVAVWLNFVLAHLSKTHPRFLRESELKLDPFAVSLSAIDQLLEFGIDIADSTKRQSPLHDKRFKVALSFPGERRAYVEKVANVLAENLGRDEVFYDKFYQAELARPNLDVLLQRIYRRNADLVVIFLSADYDRKEWCGLEWRAIRDLLKERQDDAIMLVRFDTAPIEGLFGIDGYIDAESYSSTEMAKAILTRIRDAS